MPMWDMINGAAAAAGVDPNLMARIARIESGGNPGVTTGSYKGLFQLSDSEFNKYGGGNIYNAADNSRAYASKLKAETDAFHSKYGRAPTATEIYLVHQQGAGGFDAHSANPDQPAWKSMLSTGEGRQKGATWARAAIWGNVPDNLKAQYGSVDNITSQQFVDLWRSKVEGGALNPPPAQGTNKMADPALSANFLTGGAGLFGGPERRDDISLGLQRAAAWLMAPNSDGKSLHVLDTLAKEQQLGREGNIATIATPDGGLIQYNKKTGAYRPIQGPSKPYGFTLRPDGSIARTNPNTGVVEDAAGPVKQYGFTSGPDGSVVRTDASAGTAVPVVTGEDPGTKAYKLARAKDNAEDFTKVTENSVRARSSLQDVDQMDNLVRNGGFYTGIGGEYVQQLRRVGALFKIGVEGASNAEAFQSLVNQFAMKLRNPAEGGGLPGSISDKDLQFLKQASPGLTTGVDGNLKALDYMRRIHKRALESEQFMHAYIEQHGRIDDKFRSALAKWAADNPLFPEGQSQTTPMKDRPPLSSFSTTAPPLSSFNQ
jgi:hypothetical protein